jgi:DNA-binding FadR family transcriptional regulator
MDHVDEVADPSPFSPLPRARQVSAHVAEQILDRIGSGVLPLGARLPSEAELARDFAVSRPSVREALAALQFAGHVESRRGFGTVVVSREPVPVHRHRPPLQALSQAIDLLETRLVLEPHALASAAQDPDQGALKDARTLINGMRVAANGPELRATTDILVHRALLSTCRNVILRETAADLLDLCLDPMLLTARTKAWESPDLPRVWADQHEVVCEAIATGNPEAARAGSLMHLASVVDNLSAVAAADPHLQRRLAAMTHRFGIPAHKPADDAAASPSARSGGPS